LAAWRAQGFTNLRMAVNLSVHQLDGTTLVSDLRALLNRFDLPASQLELEVTESALIKNPEYGIQQLEALRKLGVRLMLDDFGTGYSSLSYLRMLPVHGFKLDRSFVQRILHNERDLSICTMAVELAKVLDMEVVAEGVEERRQAELLVDMGCDHLQGYWFAKPLSVRRATKCLLEGAQSEVQSNDSEFFPSVGSEGSFRSWVGPQFENSVA